MSTPSASPGRPWGTTGLEILAPGDFSQGQLKRSGVYVVCFGAEWCPVTRRFMPKFLALRGRLHGALAIADITDLQNPLWDDFRIRITPSIIVFRDGTQLLRLDGKRFFGLRDADLAKLESGLAAG